MLSNSKRLFLSHLDILFRALDPGAAELCYVDTDSCVWSVSGASLDDGLRRDVGCADSVARFHSIMADESGLASCHGKLKFEGIFDGGLFKTMKIYRLFNKIAAGDVIVHGDDDDDDDDAATSEALELATAYTRCKGINRGAANDLPHLCFQTLNSGTAGGNRRDERLVVHRKALRPAETGEMRIMHEAKSLAIPFNLKRYVTSDGIHTLPFGFCRDAKSCL